jgi:hypothetical protein
VPVLGAFVGGIIGGMLAGTTIRQVVKKFEGRSFRKKVQQYEQLIEEDGSIEATPKNI